MKIFKLKNIKHQIYAWIGVTVLIILGLGFFICWPFQQKIVASQAKIQANRQKIEEMQQRQEALIYSGRSYSELQKDGGSLINNIFVSRQGVLEFINKLEGLANQNNVGQNISLNEASIEPGEEALLLTLTLEGTYSELVNYLQKLEQESFYFDWQEIVFKKSIMSDFPSNKNEEAGLLTAAVKTKVYWLD